VTGAEKALWQGVEVSDEFLLVLTEDFPSGQTYETVNTYLAKDERQNTQKKQNFQIKVRQHDLIILLSGRSSFSLKHESIISQNQVCLILVKIKMHNLLQHTLKIILVTTSTFAVNRSTNRCNIHVNTITDIIFMWTLSQISYSYEHYVWISRFLPENRFVRQHQQVLSKASCLVTSESPLATTAGCSPISSTVPWLLAVPKYRDSTSCFLKLSLHRGFDQTKRVRKFRAWLHRTAAWNR